MYPGGRLGAVTGSRRLHPETILICFGTLRRQRNQVPTTGRVSLRRSCSVSERILNKKAPTWQRITLGVDFILRRKALLNTLFEHWES